MYGTYQPEGGADVTSESLLGTLALWEVGFSHSCHIQPLLGNGAFVLSVPPAGAP